MLMQNDQQAGPESPENSIESRSNQDPDIIADGGHVQDGDEQPNAEVEAVRDAVEEALEDRFTRDVYVSDCAQNVIAVLGGQYGWDAARDIAAEDVELAVPDGWRVKPLPADVFTNDTCHIEVDSPQKTKRERHIRNIGTSIEEMAAHGIGRVNEDDE